MAHVESKPPLSNLHFGKGPRVSVAREQSGPHESETEERVHGTVGSVLCVSSHTLLGRTQTSGTVGVRAGERGDINPPPRYLSSDKVTTVKSICCDDVTSVVEVPGVRAVVLYL